MHPGTIVRALSVLLVALVGAGAARGDDDAGLVKLLSGFTTDAVPLRLRFALDLPPSRLKRAPEPMERLGDLDVLVRRMVWSAGFAEVKDQDGLDAPVLTVQVTGRETFGQPAGDAPKREGSIAPNVPTLVARVTGRLVLSTREGSWSHAFEGEAARRLASADEALQRDAPFLYALVRSPLLAGLDRIVAARGEDRLRALLLAYDGVAYAAWLSAVVAVLEPLDRTTLVRGLLARIVEDDEGLADAAIAVLPRMGDEARQALVRTPAHGPVAYRWRRHRALSWLAASEGPTPAVLAELSDDLEDPAVALRTLALRSLAEHAPTQAPPALIRALGDPHACVRAHARQALEGLSGKQLGYETAAWERWYQGTGARPAESAPAPTLPFFPLGARRPPAREAAKPGAAPDPLVAGLAALAALQRPDGSWPTASPDFDHLSPAVTALSLLALLAAGHGSGGDDPHGGVVRRALEHLRECQDGEGFVGRVRGAHGSESGHALATLALLSAYAEAPGPGLKTSAQRALDFLALSRNPYFAWRYGVKPGDNDTFCTVVHALPLLVARSINEAAGWAHLPAPFTIDEEAFDGVRAWLDKMTDPDIGRVGYTSRGQELRGYVNEPETHARPETSDRTLAFGTLLVRQGLGADLLKDRVQQATVGLALREPPQWSDGADLLGWWWGALLAQRAPKASPTWKTWTPALRSAALATLQDPERARKTRWGWIGGEAYARALAVLCLTSGQQWPVLEPTRKDLVQVVGEARAPSELRGRALRALALVAPAKALPTALTWLGDGQPLLRAAGAHVLRAHPTEALGQLARLQKAAGQAAPEARAAALEVLGALAETSEPARQTLVAALGDPAPLVRAAAARAYRGPPEALASAAEALRRQLSDSDADAVHAALDLLARLPQPPPAADLLALARHADPEVRRWALETLGRAPGDASLRLAALQEAVAAPEAPVRAAVARGLRALKGPGAVGPLTRLLSDAREEVGQVAGEGLAALGADAPGLLAALAEVLSAGPPVGRRRAADTLSLLGPAAKPCESALHAAIKGEVAKGDAWDARLLLALAEARYRVLGDTSGTASLLQALFSQSRDTDVRLRAVELLGLFPDAGDWAGQNLLDGLDEDGPLPYAVLNAFADLGPRVLALRAHAERLAAVPFLEPDLKRHAEVAARRMRGD